jgi:hypothetical protein
MRFAKQAKTLQWEKVLKVMLNGEPVTKESLEAMPEMKDVPLYRLSTFVWRIKVIGGVVKVVKDGRKVGGYALMNTAEMQKYIDRREKDIVAASSKKVAKAAKTPKVVKAPKVKKLKDLQADPVVEEVKEDSMIVDEMQITEVKETA